MKTYIAIVKSTDGKLDKFQDFETKDEAEAHAAKWGGWVAPNPGGDCLLYWVVDEAAKTLGYDQAKQDSYKEIKSWLRDMAQTDKSMTRQMEDYIDDQEVVLKPGRIKDAYNAKKEVRARKPT
jgi:hypothetical protein